MGVVFLVDCSASSALMHVHKALDIMDTYPNDIECSVYYFNHQCDCIFDKKMNLLIDENKLFNEFHPHGSTALYDAVCSVVSKHRWWDRIYIITDTAGDTSSRIHTKKDMDDLMFWRPFIYIVKVDTETQEPVQQSHSLVRSQTSMFHSAMMDLM